MSHIKYKAVLNLILLFSIFALFVAYFIQHVLKHQPCNLCLIERIPYFISIIIILFCLFFKRFEKISLIILSLTFFSAALIAFYHFGIEQDFFKESLVCDLGNNNAAISTQDLLKQFEKKIISCKDVTFRVLGLSLATFNTIISLIISAIMLKIVINYDKNK